jgi:CheY-like chemotaxis protein/HPt (histidine-containing phosphotransfer) domain-containing protein
MPSPRTTKNGGRGYRLLQAKYRDTRGPIRATNLANRLASIMIPPIRDRFSRANAANSCTMICDLNDLLTTMVDLEACQIVWLNKICLMPNRLLHWISSDGIPYGGDPWLYLMSGFAVGLAYFSIAFLLLAAIHRQRDRVLRPILGLLTVLAFFCAADNWVDLLIPRTPAHEIIESFIKLLVATLSIATTLILWKLIRHTPLASAQQRRKATPDLSEVRRIGPGLADPTDDGSDSRTDKFARELAHRTALQTALHHSDERWERLLLSASTSATEISDYPEEPVSQHRRPLKSQDHLGAPDTRMSYGPAPLVRLGAGETAYDNSPRGDRALLPGPAAATSATSPSGTEMLEARTRALHVLVVDDVAMNRDIASSFLRAAGHRVTCVESGPEAIAAVQIVEFDVILMDVRMPGMDGLEATRRIRSFDGLRGRVPIVALTAQAFTEQVAACRLAGMDCHLPKPFGPEALLAAVEQAITVGRTYGNGLTRGLIMNNMVSNLSTPITCSELPICDAKAFECTAHFLAPEAVSFFLQNIVESCEAFLRSLRNRDALTLSSDELVEAAHRLAGSAGMFGFDRAVSLSRRFVRAFQAGSAGASTLADELVIVLEETLHELHDRMSLVAAED